MDNDYAKFVSLVLSLMRAESDFNPHAESDKGAVGLMQLMPSIYVPAGIDPLDPESNIRVGCAYLKRLWNVFKAEKGLERWKFALGSYNAGMMYIIDAQRLAKEAGAKVVPGNSERYYKEVDIPNGLSLKNAKVHELILESARRAVRIDSRSPSANRPTVAPRPSASSTRRRSHTSVSATASPIRVVMPRTPCPADSISHRSAPGPIWRNASSWGFVAFGVRSTVSRRSG